MADERVKSGEVKGALDKALEDREVFIHLNGSADGVLLPPHLAGSPNVTLKISYYYRGPLVVDETKLVADLLFPDGPFACTVPLEHIWGVTRLSGESLFWPEHAPREVLEEMIRGVVQSPPDAAPSYKTAPSDKKEISDTKAAEGPKKAGNHAELRSVPESDTRDSKKVGNGKKGGSKKAQGKKKVPALKRVK